MPVTIPANFPSVIFPSFFKASYEMSTAINEQDIFNILANSLHQTNFYSAILLVDRNHILYHSSYNPKTNEATLHWEGNLPNDPATSLIKSHDPIFIGDTPSQASELNDLVSPFFNSNVHSIALLPIMISDVLLGLVLVATCLPEKMTQERLQDIIQLVFIASQNILRLRTAQICKTYLNELNSSANIPLNIACDTDLDSLYTAIHQQVFQILGNVDFRIAIYTSETNSIALPYVCERGIRLPIDHFQLGEDLISLVIKNNKPLLFVGNSENQGKADGTRTNGFSTRPFIGVPILIDEQVIGAMVVEGVERGRRFTGDDLNFMMVLAPVVSLSIKNSQAVSEIQQRLGNKVEGNNQDQDINLENQKSLAQHRLLDQIIAFSSLASDTDSILESVVQGLHEIIADVRVSILLTDHASDDLTIKAWKGYPQELDVRNFRFHLGEGVTGKSAKIQETIYIRETGKDVSYVQVDQSVNSELAIPLLYRNELLGVLNLESPNIDAFSKSDREVWGTLANSLAVIIANVRLIEQIKKQVERQHRLFEATSRIRRSIDMRSILETSAIEIGKTLGALRARIELTSDLNSTTPFKGVSGIVRESDQ